MDDISRDIAVMTEALALAGRLDARPWPNPPVGAIVMRDGEVVGRGAHLGPGTPHAERVALDQAGEAARGARLYITLEPCNHRGRTGPCAPAIIDAGVAEVVLGVDDPNPHVPGGGNAALRAAGIKVTSGVCGPACLDLIRPFAVSRGFERPFLCLKTAESADGFAAPDPVGRASRDPVYLLGEDALADVHQRRRWHDLILVGAGTVATDQPRLDGRRVPDGADCPTRDPAAGVITGRPQAIMDWRRRPHLVFTDAAEAAAHPDATVISCRGDAGGVDPADLLLQAHRRGFNVIMLEGGPRVASAFLRAGLVDQWIQYISPRNLGAGVAWPTSSATDLGLRLSERRRIGDDTCLIWDRPQYVSLRESYAELRKEAS